MDVTQTKYYLQIDRGAFPTEDKFLSPSISLTTQALGQGPSQDKYEKYLKT